MLERHTIPKGQKLKHFFLFCGDEWLEYLTAGDADPTGPDRKRTVGDSESFCCSVLRIEIGN